MSKLYHVFDSESGMTASGMISKKRFSHAEAIEAYRFAIDLLKRLYSDGNVGFFAADLSFYYCSIALRYAEMNDTENTLKSLEESCSYTVMDAELKDKNYTAPMVNRMIYQKSPTAKNYEGSACNLRIKDLADKRFDFVRNAEAFKKLAADLEKYAEP